MNCACNATSAAPAARVRGHSRAVATLDLVETPTEFRAVLDVPGTGREDIEIRAESGILFVHAAVPSREDENRRYHLREHSPRRIVRRIALGDSVNVDGITAELERGVLTVLLPKLPSAQPRRIALS